MSALDAIHPTRSQAENDLVAAVRRGDDRAFEVLFSRYRGRVVGYIAGMVGDASRAEDVAQDVFISALRRLRDTEGRIAFKPWIYEIAKNASIDEHRRAKRIKEIPLDDGADRLGRERELRSREPTPDAAMESKQRLDDLRGAFRGLSEQHHRILVMRELEGLSYGEIGQRLGVSRAVVESTLFRARRRLSHEYQELLSGRRCARIHAVIDAGEADSPRSLGIRERRELARHLSHCQPCRRHARMAGIDDSLLETPGFIGKIAALLPIPWLRWRRGSHPAPKSPVRTVAIAQPVQGASHFADQFVRGLGAGRAAAAAAALLIAGAGGGVVAGLDGHGSRVGPGHQAGAATVGVASARTKTARIGGSGPRLAPGHAARSGSTPAVRGGASSGSGRNRSHGRGPGASAGGGRSSHGSSAGAAGGNRPPGSTSPPGGGAGRSNASVPHAPSAQAVGGVAPGAGSQASNVASGLGSAVRGAGSGVSGVTSALGGAVQGAGSQVNKLTSGLGSAVRGAGSAVNGLTSAAGGAVRGAGSQVNRLTSGLTGGGIG